MNLRIFIEFDGDAYRLMCDDRRMSPTPCGQRLFRAAPHPDIKFSHETLEPAEKDAATLRAYLAKLPTKRMSKKESREVAA